MSRIVEYNILMERDHAMLIKRVNEQLAKGFQPYGSLVCCYDSHDDKTYSYQPMVKFGDTPPAPTPGTSYKSG